MNKFWIVYDPSGYGVVGGEKIAYTTGDDYSVRGFTNSNDALAFAQKRVSRRRSEVFVLEATKLVSFPTIEAVVTDLTGTIPYVEKVASIAPDATVDAEDAEEALIEF